MGKMPDGLIDLTVASPPYDGLRLYKGYSFDFENVARGLFRTTKNGGTVIWVVGDQTKNGTESGTSFKQALFFKEIGFNLHDTMIYRKKNFPPLTHNRYEQSFEYMFVFTKGKPKTFNGIKVRCKTAGDSANFIKKGSNVKEGSYRRRDEVVQTSETKLHDNIFEYSLGASRSGHPAAFPDQLAEDQILTWSNPGDLVYDPFGGSGTTGKMAKKHKRNWVMSEISAEYCQIIDGRMGPDLFLCDNDVLCKEQCIFCRIKS